MFNLFKRLGCFHRYSLKKSIISKRVVNDNHVIEIEYYKCEKCGKDFVVEILKNVEKDWYIK